MFSRGDDREQQLQRQLEAQEESATRRQLHGMNMEAEKRRQEQDFLETAISNADLERGTKKVLRNYLSRDLPLANLTNAEAHEIKWRMEYIYLRVRAMHPAEGSLWTGEFVQKASGGSAWALKPLSQPELEEIRSLIEQIYARATRGRGGFQWEKLNESISVARTEDGGDDSGGGLFG